MDCSFLVMSQRCCPNTPGPCEKSFTGQSNWLVVRVWWQNDKWLNPAINAGYWLKDKSAAAFPDNRTKTVLKPDGTVRISGRFTQELIFPVNIWFSNWYNSGCFCFNKSGRSKKYSPETDKNSDRFVAPYASISEWPFLISSILCRISLSHGSA